MATGRIPDANTAPLTAKGDLYTYSTANARLAVGSNGDTLVADSAATTGLRWSGTPSASNPIINAACEIAQRGTASVASNAATNQFMTDRWQVFRAVAGATFSRQNTSDTTNLPNIRYCIRAARDSGNTATNAVYVWQNIETANTIPFVGKTVTMSFYARAGANYSPTSSLLEVRLSTGTGTDQNYINGYTGAANPISTTATLTTTWQRFTFTGTIATTATEMAAVVYANPTGTAGANDYFEVTGWQIDIGSVALPFRTQSSTLQGELAACQRYYWRMNSANAASGYWYFATGMCESTTIALFTIPFPVQMRTSPVLATSTTANQFMIYDAGTIRALTAVPTSDGNSVYTQGLVGTTTGLTAGRAVALRSNNNNVSWLEWSAEL